MKAPRLGSACLRCFFAVCLTVGPFAAAQRGPGTRNPGSGGVGRLPNSPSSNGSTPAAFIFGKVTLDDGTEPTEPAVIQTICRGDRHTRAYTDHHGSFSFEFGDSSQGSTDDLTDVGNSATTRNSTQQDARNWRDCEVQAVLAGFSSEVIELASRMNTLESTDVGRIVLHRLEHVEGTSISVTSALAPSGAKKALDKAREAEKKKNWNRAEQALQKAVQIYPKYAAAWFELGKVQMVKRDAAGAKHSFEQAIAADGKYVPPYQGLAQLAFQAKQWQEVVRVTGKVLMLNPVNYPMAYLFSAVANYYVPNLEAAEASARQGIKLDSERQIAKLRYVMGVILLKKQHYEEASFFLHQYMQLTTESTELEAANQQLAEIERLSPGTKNEEKGEAK